MSEAAERTGTDAEATEVSAAAGRAGRRAEADGAGARQGRPRTYFDAVAARDVDAMVDCWAAGRHRPTSLRWPRPARARTRCAPSSARPSPPCPTALRGARRRRGAQPGGRALARDRHLLRRAVPGHRAHRRADRARGHRPADGRGRQDPAQRRLLRQRPVRARGRPAAAARTARWSSAWRARSTRARACCGRSSSRTSSQVADGVWLVQGGFPQKIMNVYLIEDEGQVTVFDAGIKAMTQRHRLGTRPASAASSAIVLGHGHPDHRGAAPGLGAPVFCHPDEVEDDAGRRRRALLRLLEARLVRARRRCRASCAAGTAARCRSRARSRRATTSPASRWSHLPGHAPGLIGLWRESDRLALVSDTLLHARPADRAQGRAARAAPGLQPRHRPGASPASASWRRWSRPPSGPATRIR